MRVPGVFVAGDATTGFAVDRPALPPDRVAAEGQFKAEVALVQSENSALRSQNLALAAKLHAAEKKLAAQLGQPPT